MREPIGAPLKRLSNVGRRELSSQPKLEYENYSDKRGIRGCHAHAFTSDRFQPFSPACLIIFLIEFFFPSDWTNGGKKFFVKNKRARVPSLLRHLQ